MSQSAALVHVLTNEAVLAPTEQVAPRENLDFAVPDDEHLEGVDLCLDRVEALAGVGALPLLQLGEKELHRGEQLHQGCLLAVEARDDIVREEDALVEQRAFILVSDDDVAQADQQVLHGLVDEASLLGVRIVVEIVRLGQVDFRDVHDLLRLRFGAL